MLTNVIYLTYIFIITLQVDNMWVNKIKSIAEGVPV